MKDKNRGFDAGSIAFGYLGITPQGPPKRQNFPRSMKWKKKTDGPKRTQKPKRLRRNKVRQKSPDEATTVLDSTTWHPIPPPDPADFSPARPKAWHQLLRFRRNKREMVRMAGFRRVGPMEAICSGYHRCYLPPKV
jgi:hypothetical protein